MHIVLADDHKLVVDALKMYLTKLRPELEVTQAGNFEEALKQVSESTDLDLVILDMNMPGMNGLEGLRVMRARYPDVPIVMMSGVANSEQVREALDCGAVGFIPKALSGSVMLGALELVLSGGTYVPTMALYAGSAGKSAGTDIAEQQFDADNPLTSLTRRQREVLSLLIQGHSNKKIARQCGVTPNTAAFHVKGVMRKLGASNRTEAVTAAIRHGWEL